MLSILIPVYNFDVTTLVQELCKQGRECGKAFEILCFDDGSRKEILDVNKRIGKYEHVSYQLLPYNHGRSKIRNKLASKALYDNLSLIHI